MNFRDHLSRGLRVLLVPERMVVRHRLAPVTHHEIGVHFRSLAKRFQSLFVPKRMQRSNATQEMRLRRFRARGREINLTERAALPMLSTCSDSQTGAEA
jgi:hypothetical protein